MKKLIGIVFTVILLLILSITICADEESLANKVDNYYTYYFYDTALDGKNEEYIQYYEPIVAYWEEKFNEITVDDVRYFKYHPDANGGIQKLIEHYYKNNSLLSATVSVTDSQIENILTYTTVEKAIKSAEYLIGYINNKDFIKWDFYNIVLRNPIIYVAAEAQANFDPLSSDLKFYLITGYNWGNLLAITDGKYEVYFVLNYARFPVYDNENRLYSPRQLLGLMLLQADWTSETENKIGVDYTKSAPSTGGGNFASNAALMESAGLILGLAVVSKKKKG